MTKCDWVNRVDSKIRNIFKHRIEGVPNVEIQLGESDRSSYDPTQNLCKISYLAALKFYDFFRCMVFHTGSVPIENQVFFEWKELGKTDFEVPLSNEQSENAEFFAECAIVFIALHELAHHLRGHFEFLDDNGQPNQETVNNYHTDSWLISQVLEIDADYYAYRCLLKMVDDVLQLENGTAEEKMYAKSQWLMALCYGVLLVRENPNQSENYQNSHPVGLTRYRYITSTSLAAASSELKGTVIKAFQDVQAEYESALPALFGSKMPLILPADDGNEHDTQIFDLYGQMLSVIETS
ncbi:MAG: hypothetical protein MI864_24980 [Pseudomonadales bacterium]|nr:hypothetical protein [Pseudomonadales bacterium]